MEREQSLGEKQSCSKSILRSPTFSFGQDCGNCGGKALKKSLPLSCGQRKWTFSLKPHRGVAKANAFPTSHRLLLKKYMMAFFQKGLGEMRLKYALIIVSAGISFVWMYKISFYLK